jgi:hypothetical protein
VGLTVVEVEEEEADKVNNTTGEDPDKARLNVLVRNKVIIPTRVPNDVPYT